MATLAEFSLPPDAVPLGVVFQTFPNVTVELERVVPSGRAGRSYFWVENAPDGSLVESLCGHPAIEEPTLVDQFEGWSLFRYRRPDGRDDVLQALVDSDVTLLSAVGTQDGWTIHVRGDEQRSLSTFDERCRAAGVQLTLRDFHGSPAAERSGSSAVTDAQREALSLAYERGYYAEPRETSLGDLAAEVGISRQAFASRLTRGYRGLIRSQLRPVASD